MRTRSVTGVVLAAILAGGCGGHAAPAGQPGSTLRSALGDPNGDGALQHVPGQRLIARTDIAPAAPPLRRLATFGVLADAHLRDEESPARLPFLDRLGGVFQSTFRPQESLTPQVLAATLRSLDALRLDAVIEAGDLVDNAQGNELSQALAVLRGGVVNPNSGARGYSGVQSASNPDPFFYRPDVDAPREPGLLAAAQRPFRSPGLRGPWYPVLGNHDVLVQGEVAPTRALDALAVGARRIVAPPAGLNASDRAGVAPAEVDSLLRRVAAGRTAHTAPDRARAFVVARTAIDRLRAASGHGAVRAGRLDYTFDVGARLRVVVLDTVRRDAGSEGVVSPAQRRWLRAQLAAAGQRWVVVVSHHPLERSVGGAATLAVLDRDPHVAAAISGHTHRNRIVPRRTRSGGYWLISTDSVVDYPQQARAFELVETAGGGAALRTWLVDHADEDHAGVARELSFLDAQGGRPGGYAGRRLDRNVTLFLARP